MTDPTSPMDHERRIAHIEKAQMMGERNHSDLATTTTRTLELLKALETRVQLLEIDRQEQRVTDAATGVEGKQLRADVHEIKNFMGMLRDQNVIGKVNNISDGFNKLFWLVIAAIVTGSIGLLFVALRGGF